MTAYHKTILLSKAVTRNLLEWFSPDPSVCFLLFRFPYLSPASSGVTRVGDTQGGNWGCHPSIFSRKTWRPFFLIAVIITIAFIAFTRVSPRWGCHPTPFLPVRPRFSTILCKFAHNFYSFGCHPPLKGVTRGGPPALPSDSTVCLVSLTGPSNPANGLKERR